MNLMHDPRWGRNDESYGEDPLLETKMVSQFVDGMEGKDENGQLLPGGDGFYKTTTTIKHYAMNNSEVNRRTRLVRRRRADDPRVLHEGVPRGRPGLAAGRGDELVQQRERRADRGRTRT